MKKKVLYINTFEPPYRVKFYNLLGSHYDVTMLFSQTNEERQERNAKWFSEEERNYRRIWMKTRRIHGENVAFEIRERLKKRDFDLVFIDTYGDLANMYAIHCLKRLRIPYVFSVDGMLPREKESRLAYLVKKYLLSSPEFILSPGKSVDDCLVHYGVDRSKLRRYHFTSLSEQDFAQAEPLETGEKQMLRQKLRMTEQNIVISVGRFTYEHGYGKGYDILMKAAQRLDGNIGFYIIGDEPTEEFVQWKVEKHLDHIHFVGFQTKNELREYYQAADAFILPTREDIWGLVVNEAMSYGLPVITTDRCVAGLELVADEENGYLLPVGDIEGTVEGIRRIFEDPERLCRMGRRSREKIRPYTSEQMAADTIACFEEFLRRRTESETEPEEYAGKDALHQENQG